MTDCPECLELLDEIRELELQIADWQARRTTGGPTGAFTYGWRNQVLPRVETAPPLEDDDE
jgi:hypothetical protein